MFLAFTAFWLLVIVLIQMYPRFFFVFSDIVLIFLLRNFFVNSLIGFLLLVHTYSLYSYIYNINAQKIHTYTCKYLHTVYRHTQTHIQTYIQTPTHKHQNTLAITHDINWTKTNQQRASKWFCEESITPNCSCH